MMQEHSGCGKVGRDNQVPNAKKRPEKQTVGQQRQLLGRVVSVVKGRQYVDGGGGGSGLCNGR